MDQPTYGNSPLALLNTSVGFSYDDVYDDLLSGMIPDLIVYLTKAALSKDLVTMSDCVAADWFRPSTWTLSMRRHFADRIARCSRTVAGDDSALDGALSAAYDRLTAHTPTDTTPTHANPPVASTAVNLDAGWKWAWLMGELSFLDSPAIAAKLVSASNELCTDKTLHMAAVLRSLLMFRESAALILLASNEDVVVCEEVFGLAASQRCHPPCPDVSLATCLYDMATSVSRGSTFSPLLVENTISLLTNTGRHTDLLGVLLCVMHTLPIFVIKRWSGLTYAAINFIPSEQNAVLEAIRSRLAAIDSFSTTGICLPLVDYFSVVVQFLQGRHHTTPQRSLLATLVFLREGDVSGAWADLLSTGEQSDAVAAVREGIEEIREGTVRGGCRVQGEPILSLVEHILLVLQSDTATHSFSSPLIQHGFGQLVPRFLDIVIGENDKLIAKEKGPVTRVHEQLLSDRRAFPPLRRQGF